MHLVWLLVDLLQNLASSDSADVRITVDADTVSFWCWLAMVNATDRSFYNELYYPDIYNKWVSYK